MAGLLRRFDGVSLSPFQWRIPLARARAALKNLPSARRAVLTETARNVERFHREEWRRETRSWQKNIGGLTVGQRVMPVESAGLYVPGGRFAYPSTVLMTAIPARVAGVGRVVVATPPRHLTDDVLAACALAGVDEIYQIGGVAAIGALAFGTRSVKKVDFIAGPGGAWVTEAKRRVFGRVGIDMLAGPSEIVVLSDGSSPPAYAAADLMAQAEHDPLARAMLVAVAQKVLEAVKLFVEPCYRAQCRFVKAKDWNEAVALANACAPEHLSLMVRRPQVLLPKIKNAGAVFLGAASPVAAGDYWAGPSHVLPTARSARFSSGLSVRTFLKRSSLISVTPALMGRKASFVARLARAEGLERHAWSLEVRRD